MNDLKSYSKREKTLDSLIQTLRILNENVGMQFGIDKWAMLVMKNGKIDGIQSLNNKVIKSLREGEL